MAAIVGNSLVVGVTYAANAIWEWRRLSRMHPVERPRFARTAGQIAFWGLFWPVPVLFLVYMGVGWGRLAVAIVSFFAIGLALGLLEIMLV